MEPRRSPEQVLAAARAMDEARAAGLPGDLLVVMVAARAAWWGEGQWPARDELTAAIAHPASRLVDEVIWRVIRDRVAPRA
ncbi:hypothetical protein [Cellulomonas massiliensis]|uniref:hypothetical protein n=1 Tax=Cellulomonas massiliensis TaxID=1465811 RepID=UPI0002E34C1F|nr:hypothetical protein [Cellulomonas massiliensis]